MDEKSMKDLESKMEKAIEALHKEFNRVRTGRASVSLLDGIRVDYYGTPTPLNQVATLSVPDGRLITIQPWDTTLLGEVEKAIQRSELGLTPINDGRLIRISIPTLTEERRKELVKIVKKRSEECRVALRNCRRAFNEDLKKLKKEKKISEDEWFRDEEEVQGITNEYIKKCDAALEAKEREILEF